uniref:Uncharacterized protein n=1 Tax=Rhizophora mucronata TaxID=61149 RepID=A0A2P2NBE8_RHIMU
MSKTSVVFSMQLKKSIWLDGKILWKGWLRC